LKKPVWDFNKTPKENYPLLLHYHPLHLYRHQVCKQADTVLAHCLFEDLAPVDVRKRSFDYYEAITTHDSSLSSCIFSIGAAKLGLMDKAMAYFGDCVKTDLKNTHGNTGDGLHTAVMGGGYMAVVQGFAGLRLNDELSLTPRLPSNWRRYSFRFRYKGNLLCCTVSQDASMLEILEGQNAHVQIYGKPYEVTPDSPAKFELMHPLKN
jgi:alpha,alpha-trehalose phosphorylase